MTTSAAEYLRQAREELTPTHVWVKGKWMVAPADKDKSDPKNWQACAMGAMYLSNRLFEGGKLVEIEPSTEDEPIWGDEYGGQYKITGTDERHDVNDHIVEIADRDPRFYAAISALHESIHTDEYLADQGIDREDLPCCDTDDGDADVESLIEAVTNFNDGFSTTHEQVLAAFDNAIRKLEAQEG